MTTPYRVAVIGCGAISGNHIAAIMNAGQSICALCDILPERAQKMIEKHALKNVSVYTDYQTLLDTERPDAVHICTPHDLHAPMAIAALEKNRHVLCEKPLSLSVEQLHDLKQAVRSLPPEPLRSKYAPSEGTGAGQGCRGICFSRLAPRCRLLQLCRLARHVGA